MPTVTNNITVSAVGASVLNTASPSAVSWIRVNADNTITYRTAAQTLSDLGAETALTFSTGLTRTVNTITIDNTVVTLTGAQALSNKTGLISQWTNDSGYLTSAVTAVTGSGNIASSGGATPNITFIGVLPTANGGTAVNIASAALVLGTASTTAGQLTLSNATNAFTQTLRGTNPTASIIYDLPTTAPTLGQVLSATAPAAGVVTLSWATASSGITVGTTTITSGTSGRIPYNSAGIYTENSGLMIGGSSVVMNLGKNTTGYSWLSLNNIAIGQGAGGGAGANYPSYIVAVGSNALNGVTSSQSSTALGYYTLSTGDGWYRTAVGAAATGTGNSVLLLGYGANSGSSTNVIVIGAAAATSGAGVYNNLYFNGVTHTSAAPIVINACGGSGTNNAGANLGLAGGKGTGSAAGGNYIVSTSTTLGSGTTLQTLVPRLTISGGAVTTDASTATWADALDFVFGTTTGTKIGTGTTQKIGFWNATPLAQQTTASAASTFVANTSLIANDTATFDGYTLGQVVKILRNLGILA